MENNEKKWISVKDRLPEINNLVLLFHKEDGFIIGYLGSYGLFHLNEYYYERNFYLHEISYWQPLPNPPKKGANDE